LEFLTASSATGESGTAGCPPSRPAPACAAGRRAGRRSGPALFAHSAEAALLARRPAAAAAPLTPTAVAKPPWRPARRARTYCRGSWCGSSLAALRGSLLQRHQALDTEMPADWGLGEPLILSPPGDYRVWAVLQRHEVVGELLGRLRRRHL